MRTVLNPSLPIPGGAIAIESEPQGALNTPAIAFCCAAMAALIPILLYQTKRIGDLPDPPGEIFDSESITRAEGAYPFGIPDSLLGLASYGATLALLLQKSPRRSMPEAALRAKLSLDAGMAAFQAARQIVHFRRLCSWCMGTALATAGMAYCGLRRSWS